MDMEKDLLPMSSEKVAEVARVLLISLLLKEMETLPLPTQ